MPYRIEFNWFRREEISSIGDNDMMISYIRGFLGSPNPKKHMSDIEKLRLRDTAMATKFCIGHVSKLQNKIIYNGKY